VCWPLHTLPSASGQERNSTNRKEKKKEIGEESDIPHTQAMGDMRWGVCQMKKSRNTLETAPVLAKAIYEIKTERGREEKKKKRQ